MGIEDYFELKNGGSECVVLEKSTAQDSVGGDAGTYSVVAGSNFFGYIGRPKPNERLSGGIETMFVSNILTYPVSVSLTKHMRVKCTAGPDYVDKVFDVIPIKSVHGHHKKAELSMVEE